MLYRTILLIVCFSLSISVGGGVQAAEYLDVLTVIRDDIAYYDTAEDAIWVMLDDSRLDIGFLRQHFGFYDMQSYWPALEELHLALHDFMLFSAAVEVAAMDNSSRFDPTLRERLQTLANRTMTIASSPATGMAQVILEVSLDRFARGVYASVNQRFWGKYQEYQAQYNQDDFIAAMEPNGFDGLIDLMDGFWEQEEVEYARDLRALDNAYPNARDAYRSQYILQHLMAAPDPLLPRWMEERRRQATSDIIRNFHRFVTEWGQTGVTLSGTVHERYLEEHPVPATIHITPGELAASSIAVKDSQYHWRTPVRNFFDAIEREWWVVELEFLRTEGADVDYQTPSVGVTLPVLIRTGGVTMQDGRLHVTVPPMEVMHFSHVQLEDDVPFRLLGPRRSLSIPYEHPTRPYGRYQLVHENARKDVTLNQAEHIFSLPSITAIPDPVTWPQLDPDIFFDTADPLQAFLDRKEHVRSEMLARVEIISGEMRRLRELYREEEDPDLERRLEHLQLQRQEQSDRNAALNDVERNFREALQQHRSALNAAEQERQRTTSELVSVYAEAERLFQRVGYTLSPMARVGRSVLSWHGIYSTRWWNEESFEQHVRQDTEQIRHAYKEFFEQWRQLEVLREQKRALESRDHDAEEINHHARPSTRETIRRSRAYLDTAFEIDASEQVEEVKQEVLASIESFRYLPLEVERLLEALADEMDTLPPMPDTEEAALEAAALQGLLAGLLEGGDPRSGGRALQQAAQKAEADYADYLPAEVLDNPGWHGRVREIIASLRAYRSDWGMHAETMNNTIREAQGALFERALPALVRSLADVRVYMAYGSEHHRRIEQLQTLLHTADSHVGALDDSLGYIRRMDQVTDAFAAVEKLPGLWKDPRLEPITASFEQLLTDQDGLENYARQRGLVYPVWTQLRFGWADDALLIEIPDMVQYKISREHWEEGEHGITATAELAGSGLPVRVPMELTYESGFSRIHDRISPDPDGYLQLPLGTTANPHAAVVKAGLAMPRPHPFYGLMRRVSQLSWAE